MAARRIIKRAVKKATKKHSLGVGSKLGKRMTKKQMESAVKQMNKARGTNISAVGWGVAGAGAATYGLSRRKRKTKKRK